MRVVAMIILACALDNTTTVRFWKNVFSSHQREFQFISNINNLLAEQDRAEF